MATWSARAPWRETRWQCRLIQEVRGLFSPLFFFLVSTPLPGLSVMYGRHFDFNDRMVSLISRRSINALKEFFAKELKPEDIKVGVLGLCRACLTLWRSCSSS